MAKNEEKRKASYEALNAYIEEHHHLPDKHKIENRGLLNWATTSHRSDLQRNALSSAITSSSRY